MDSVMILRTYKHIEGGCALGLQEGEKRLYDDVSDAEDKVHHALLDSINTKDALGALTDLMAAVNRYMLSGR